MLHRCFEINGCRHYLASAGAFIVELFAEPDQEIKHPMGLVWKLKTVAGNPIRFIFQPNNSILIFNSKEWHEIHPPATLKNRIKLIINNLFN
jgi:hypothetical protein